MDTPIVTFYNDGVRVIKFNRPEKRNALNQETYRLITKILNDDAGNNEVALTIFTGLGDYYSSGNDLSDSYTKGKGINMVQSNFVEDFKNLIDALINYPKLLISVINGPAIGSAVMILGLFDIIYASTRATFQIPISVYRVCPIGCSSYTLPKILGKSKAGELFYLNKKMTAQEAYQFGFITEIVEHENLEHLFEKLKNDGKEFKVNPIKATKHLIVNDIMKNKLMQINRNELEQFTECSQLQEFQKAALKFLTKESKL